MQSKKHEDHHESRITLLEVTLVHIDHTLRRLDHRFDQLEGGVLDVGNELTVNFNAAHKDSDLINTRLREVIDRIDCRSVQLEAKIDRRLNTLESRLWHITIVAYGMLSTCILSLAKSLGWL